MTTPAQRRRALEYEFFRKRKEQDELRARVRLLEKRLNELYMELYVDADFKDGEVCLPEGYMDEHDQQLDRDMRDAYEGGR